MSFKNAIKKLLPERIVRRIGATLVQQRERRMSRLTIQNAFDEVYKKSMWKQGESLSGLGSEGPVVDQYINFVLTYAQEHDIHTVVDAGCGDFSVGSRLVEHFEGYTALDISPHIIALNKLRFAELTCRLPLSFTVADMTVTAFPSADLILIRQVLQHLTNTQIESILVNLEASKWRRVLITEEVYDPDNNQTPNVDLPFHTVRTRVAVGSGVFIDREPFKRHAKRLTVIRDNDEQNIAVPVGLLVFELTREDDCLK